MRKLLLGCAATLTGMIGYAGLDAAHAQSSAATLAPGQVTVRLNGRVNWYAGIEGSSLDNISSTGQKTSTDSFLGYMRLYPGFDGVAANGLHYGAAAEIRMNSGQTAQPRKPSTSSRPMAISACPGSARSASARRTAPPSSLKPASSKASTTAAGTAISRA